MVTKCKPIVVAIAVALGASTAAFAQSETRIYGNTGTTTAYGSGARSMDEEHGGFRNRVMNRESGVRGAADNTNSFIAPASPDYASRDGYAAEHDRAWRERDAAEDVRERAVRDARATSEEEHGGTRNWIKDKKDRAREKLGMRPDQD